MVPVGEQLIEKNRLTSTRTITAAVHFSYNVGNGWTSRRVWFSPPGYWRVEDADGVELVVGPDYTYRGVDGRVERYPTRAQTGLRGGAVWMMEPHQVLAMFDRWPAPESQSQSGLQLQISTGLVAWTTGVGDS